jgi:small subunit ribosomal protein S5
MLNSALWGMKLATTLPTKPQQQARTVTATASVMGSYIEDEEEESEEDITAAYEALYGKAFEGLKKGPSPDDNLGDGEDEGRRRGRGGDRGGGDRRKGAGDSMEERVVQIRRVTKVVKGGKQLSFRAVVVIGDKKGTVGVGVGSAKEVITAVQKSATDARRHLVTVPMTKYLTFPHRADGDYGAAKVMLRPAATGTGVIAGGAVRVVLELAGVENALGKELGSKNPLNNARAVIEAVGKMKQFRDVARDRGIPMEELWK